MQRPALTFSRNCSFAFVAFILACSAKAFAAQTAATDFNRDIRPILSDNCYTCHGPDSEKRKAGLRLDQREVAVSELKSGNHAIVPGDPSKSALVARITTADDDDRMPPLKTGKHLSPDQINKLTKWIAEGAKWKAQWSFVPPERPEVPAVKNKRWPRNPIDSFIMARLDKEHLSPEKQADKVTLIRRVTLDLTGLPPTPAEVDSFLADSRTDAYERLVDRLLASPRYGENMARYWLDAARYGDTHGLHLDNERSLWPYRDWVVSAFNRDEPFDQFTIDQIAGDLVPHASQEQRVGSGFNRCNVSTSEGGAIDEEFYVRYAVDRTETFSVVFMGLTAGCAVCHDHKFDPISQKEFYQLYAFFNSNDEKAMDGNALLPAPVLKLPTADQKRELRASNARIRPTEKKISEEAAKVEYKEPGRKSSGGANSAPADFVWVDDDFPAGAKAEVNDGTQARRWVEMNVFSGTRALMRTASGVAQDFFTGATQPLIFGKGDKIFAYVYLDPANPPKAIMLQYHTSEWLHRANWGDPDIILYGSKGTTEKVQAGPLPETGKWVRLEVDAGKLGLKPGTKVDGIAFTQFAGTAYWDKAGIVTAAAQEDLSAISEMAWEQQQKAKESAALPRDVLEAIQLPRGKRSKAQAKLVRNYYIGYVYAPERQRFAPYINEIADIKKQRDALDNSLPATMVMHELPAPKPAYVLRRGEYDKRGEEVWRNVPKALPPLPPFANGATNYTRLDLANWLVSKEHPLTSRVFVNRLWQQFFGTGLVKTSGDFGAQGEWPSHPELLDWLACEFRDGSSANTPWDIKAMVRMMVTSSTYRQDSRVAPEKLQADPENRLLARGSRFRLDAEEIRDDALFVSGLLVEKMGGHAVKPYQPEGIWEAVGYTASNTAKFKQDHGEALYRRSIYTFWKRTAPPPTLVTFDAPSREKYCVRRERTDTPLQALVTMNDPQYVEAARHLAERLVRHSRKIDENLDYGFKLLTSRVPTKRERSIFEQTLNKSLLRYKKNPDMAKKLLAVGESPADQKLNPAELAAYTIVSSVLLNMDEVLNKN